MSSTGLAGQVWPNSLPTQRPKRGLIGTIVSYPRSFVFAGKMQVGRLLIDAQDYIHDKTKESKL